MTGSPIVPGDLFARHQIVAGLRALADFIADNPAVPIDEYGDVVTVYTRTGCDRADRAQVDQVAALLGVDVVDRTRLGGHYSATRRFGRVTYKIVHIPARASAEHNARMSYADNIRTDHHQDGAAA